MKNYSYKSTIRAWTMYDWANSAFVTSVITVLMPVYYTTVAGGNLPGNLATVYWGYTLSIALAIAALISPVLGTLADIRGTKKRSLGMFVALGISGTIMLYFAGDGQWLKASVFFILGNVGFAGANVFYDALLPHVARPDDIDKVSARGFAMGYLGGGILLAINLFMIRIAPDKQFNEMIRLSFLSVAIWWFIFSIPLWRAVQEPQSQGSLDDRGLNSLVVSFSRLRATFKEISKYKEVLKFLAALLLYTDAIGTIIKMGVLFAAEIGIPTSTIILIVLSIQFVSIPFSIAFGWLAGKIGSKQSIYLGLFIYTIATLGAYLMQTEVHFWLIGISIAMAQGGTAAMTRSLGASMIPKSRSGEFFGFVSVLIKFAGIAGPTIFSLIALVMGSTRLGFLSLTFFFLSGAFILSRVDEQKAIQFAQEEDARWQSQIG